MGGKVAKLQGTQLFQKTMPRFGGVCTACFIYGATWPFLLFQQFGFPVKFVIFHHEFYVPKSKSFAVLVSSLLCKSRTVSCPFLGVV